MFAHDVLLLSDASTLIPIPAGIHAELKSRSVSLYDCIPFGVILTGAVFQAEGRILRAHQQPDVEGRMFEE
jgi:hypothetical protein